MNLKQLGYIVAIADEQNIARAADKLFLSRPALNHYLLDLETELGTPLFKRLGRRLVPTYAGKLYIDSARQILDIKKQTYKALEDLADDRIGCLSIGVTRGIGNAMLAEVFPKFHARYPMYTLDLVEGNVRELEAAVLEGKTELCVVGSGSIDSKLQHITCTPCEVVVALPPDHPLGRLAAPPGMPYATLDLQLLQDDYFVLMNADTNIRAIADKHFRQAGFTPKVRMECSMNTLAYHMVRNGIGPSILMAHQIRPGDGVHCFSLSPKEIWYQSIAFREGTHFSKAEKYFIELVLNYFTTSTVTQIFG